MTVLGEFGDYTKTSVNEFISSPAYLITSWNSKEELNIDYLSRHVKGLT